MSSRPRCSVVVPVHGRLGVTARCLDAVLETTGDAAQVIVVDDGSPAGMRELLGRYGDRVDLVAHDTATGYARACNDGAEAALAPEIVFLNSDTVPRPGWLDALHREAEDHPEAAVVGSRLLFPDDTVQHAGVVVCSDGIPRHLYRGFPGEHPAVLRSRRLQIVTGACMLVKREPFERVGGFDPAYRNGYEDVDLCLRLDELGYQVRYCAESVVVHLESVSLAQLERRPRAADAAHNVRLYRDRWATRVQPDDVRIYAEDGLLSLDYAASGRPTLRLSPLLARIEASEPETQLEEVLELRDRQVSELLGDLIDLTVALAEVEVGPERQPDGQSQAPAPVSAERRASLDEEIAGRIHELQAAIAERRGPDPGPLPTARLAYAALRRRIQTSVASKIPAGSSVLVASHGDDQLVRAGGIAGRHFPETDAGAYAGHHPACGADAIDELEARRLEGAEYFVLPHTMRWWLEHYGDFARHLDRYPKVASEEACDIYALEEE